MRIQLQHPRNSNRPPRSVLVLRQSMESGRMSFAESKAPSIDRPQGFRGFVHSVELSCARIANPLVLRLLRRRVLIIDRCSLCGNSEPQRALEVSVRLQNGFCFACVCRVSRSVLFSSMIFFFSKQEEFVGCARHSENNVNSESLCQLATERFPKHFSAFPPPIPNFKKNFGPNF